MVPGIHPDCLDDHAAEWCNADAARQNHGGAGGLFVKRHRSEGPFDPGLCAQGHALEHPLERCVSKARGEHEVGLLGSTGQRKRAGVSFLIRLKRCDQGYVGRLAGGELKLAGLFEEKGHRLFGDFLAILELYNVWAHQPSSLQVEDWTIPKRRMETRSPPRWGFADRAERLNRYPA